MTWQHFQKPGGNYQNPTKCQKWGHGRKNCRMDTKCMICGGSSHAKDVCPVKEDTTKFICANCGSNHQSNFWACPSRRRVVEARARQMKNNVRYDNIRFRNFPGRVLNNAHFSVNDRLIRNHTHQEDHNHAHSQTNFNLSGTVRIFQFRIYLPTENPLLIS